MKKFIKNIPGQIASTFAIMVVCFTAISFSKGIERIFNMILRKEILNKEK